MSQDVTLRMQIQGDAQVQSKIRAVNQELQKTQGAATQAQGPISRYGQTVDNTAKSADKAAKANQTMGTKIQNAAGGFALAGSSAVSLWNAYDNVTDSAKKVEISENRVNQTELRLSKAREALVKLQQSGSASALDLAQAQQQVQVAEGNVERAAFNLTNAQEALNESWLNAATSIIPSVFTGISGLGMIVNAFKGSQVADAAANDISTASLVTNAGAATIAGGATARLGATAAVTGPALVEVGGAAGIAAGGAGALAAGATAATPPVAGLAVATNSMVLPLTLVAAAFVGLAALAVVVEKNMWGIGDAFKGFADWIHGLLGAFPGLQKGFDVLVEKLVWLRQNFVGLLEQIPFLGDYIKNLGKDTKTAEEPLDEMAQTAETVKNKLDGMSPAVQQLAKDWQLYGNEAYQASAKGQQLVAGLQAIQDKQDEGIKTAREFAIAQGVPVMDAFSMSGDELLNFVVNLGTLKDAEKSAAETAQEEAQKFADAWMTSFDSIVASQEEFSSNMTSAIGKMGQELGSEMEVGLSDIEKKVSKGSQALGEQFAKEIFPEDFLATAIIEGNDPADITAELKDFMHDVVHEGLITKEEAGQMFDPLLGFMQHDLPANAEQAMGYLIGRMPHLMDQLKPVIVNGIKVAGGEARAALKSSLVDPLLEGLGSLKTGMSGLDLGRGLLTLVDSIMPKLQKEFPQIAGLMQQTLDDAALTTDQKTQEIIGFLGQISPEWKDQIMKMDKDADGIPDLIDEKIMSPMEEMRLTILEMAADIALALGNTKAYDILERKINALTGAASGAANEIAPMTTTINGVTYALSPFGTRLGEVTKNVTDAGGAALISAGYFDNLAASVAKFKEAHEGRAPTLALNPTKQYDTKTFKINKPAETGVLDGFVQSIKDGVAALPGTIAKFVNDTDWTGVGTALYNALAATGKWLNDAVTVGFVPWITDAMTELYNIVSGYLASVDWGNVGLQAQNAIVDSAKWLYDAFSTKIIPFAASGIVSLSTTIGNYLASVDWGAVGLQAQNAIVDSMKWLNDVFSDKTLGPILSGAVGGLPGLVAYYVISGDWKTLGDKINNAIATNVAPALGTAFGNFGAWIATAIADGTTDLPQKLTSAGTTVWNAIKGLFAHPEQATAAVAELPGQVSTAITNIDWGGAFNKAFGDSFVKQGGPAALQKIIGNVDSLLTWINQGLQALPEYVKGGLVNLAGQFGSAIQSGWSSLVSSAGHFFKDAIIGPSNSFLNWLNQGITGLPKAIGDAILALNPADIMNGITGLFGKLGDPLGWLNNAITGGADQNRATPIGLHIGPAPAGGGGSNGLPNFNQADRGPMNEFGQNTTKADPSIDLLPKVQSAITQMATLWAGHVTMVTNAVTAIGQQLIKLATGYGLLSQGIGTAFTQVIDLWTGHITTVGGQVNAVGAQLLRLAAGYNALVQGVGAAFGQMMVSWGGHVLGVGGQVNAIGQSLIKLIGGYGLMATATNTALTVATQSWNTHANQVADAVNSAAKSASALANSIQGSMRSIVQSMSQATSAARTLANAINNLHNKDITVTTHYKTTGSKSSGSASGRASIGAAKGFSGIVSQPTRFFTGEGNRPEHVQITPLAPNSSGKVKMNSAAASGAAMFSSMSPTVRAGGSSGSSSKKVDRIIFNPDGTEIIYYSNGRVKTQDFRIKHPDTWREDDARKKAKGVKGLKGSEALKKVGIGDKYREKPKSEFHAVGLARTKDPLYRSAKAGGLVGRGGKSLVDLGVATGRYAYAYVVDEKRYADGSVTRIYSDGSIEFGKDKFNIKDRNKKKAKKKKGKYGFSGIVSQPTQFMAGEGKRSEHVSIQPLENMGSNEIRGRANKRVTEMIDHYHIHIDGKEITDVVRKRLLGGTYSMQ